MNDNAVTIRIFTGVHLGAELSLSIGSYTIGKDDACDIILQDESLELQHVRLVVDVRDENIIVQLIEIDGYATLAGARIESGIELEARKPYYIGQTCFAWTEFGSYDYTWNTVNLAMQNSMSQEISNLDESEQDIGQVDKDEALNNENNTGNNVGIDALTTDNVLDDSIILPDTSKNKKSKLLRYGSFLIIIIFLAFLSISIKKTVDLIPDNSNLLEKKLSEDNFAHLQVSEDNEIISVSGIVKDDMERASLLQLAQNMQFPVRLDVTINDDVKNAILRAYEQQDFHPSVKILHKENKIIVSGYIKDQVNFYVADAYMQENVPDIMNYHINYNVHYAREIKSLLDKRLNKLRLIADVEYLVGTILAVADFNSIQKSLFNDNIKDIEKELDIPILITLESRSLNKSIESQDVQPIVASNTNKAPVTKAVKQEDSSSNNNFEMNIKVSSVTLNPIKFIILASGERIFEGGTLPGGYVVEKIDVDALNLNLNGIKTVFSLK